MEGYYMYFGEKVLLRAHNKADMEKAARFLNDYELQKLKDKGVVFPSSNEEIEAIFLDMFSKHREKQYGFAIEALDSGEYIGWCGYTDRKVVFRTAEVGIGIFNKEYWGKGYGTDALKTLIRFLFNELNLRKIMLNVYDFNERGIRCYKKIGFVEEGRLRKQIYRGGEYHDMIVMGLFREEFIG
jgi:RimJ/RimL family protein N-acetyltransferase